MIAAAILKKGGPSINRDVSRDQCVINVIIKIGIMMDTDYPTDSIRYPTLNWLRVSTIHYPIIFDYRSRSKQKIYIFFYQKGTHNAFI